MTLNTLRFVLSTAALFFVATIATLTLFFGADLNATQVGLLTLFGSALISEVRTSAAYVFKDNSKEPQ